MHYACLILIISSQNRQKNGGYVDDRMTKFGCGLGLMRASEHLQTNQRFMASLNYIRANFSVKKICQKKTQILAIIGIQ